MFLKFRKLFFIISFFLFFFPRCLNRANLKHLQAFRLFNFLRILKRLGELKVAGVSQEKGQNNCDPSHLSLGSDGGGWTRFQVGFCFFVFVPQPQSETLSIGYLPIQGEI